MTTAKTEKKPALRTEVLAMLDLILAFSELLKHETKALKTSDFAAVDGLQPEKRSLARRYQDTVQALAARRQDMASLDLDVREKLTRARAQFTLLLEDNMRALELAKNSAGRLADRILQIARAAVVDEKQTHYSSKAMTGAYKSATSSLSVNEEL